MTPTTQDAGLIERELSDLALAAVLRSRGKNNSLFDIRRAADRLEALSQPPLAGPPEPEAVAWQARLDPDCEWQPVPSPNFCGSVGWEIRPLYASPVPAPKPTEEEVFAAVALSSTLTDRAEIHAIARRVLALWSRNDG